MKKDIFLDLPLSVKEFGAVSSYKSVVSLYLNFQLLLILGRSFGCIYQTRNSQ